jgi:hypothetical protein
MSLLKSVNIANRTLAGFTTVRDLGGSGVNVALRDHYNGTVSGPRIFTAPEKSICNNRRTYSKRN